MLQLISLIKEEKVTMYQENPFVVSVSHRVAKRYHKGMYFEHVIVMEVKLAHSSRYW